MPDEWEIVDPLPLTRTTIGEVINDKIESIRVWWFMLDAQQKQILLLAFFYSGLAILDVVKTMMIAKVNNGT